MEFYRNFRHVTADARSARYRPERATNPDDGALIRVSAAAILTAVALIQTNLLPQLAQYLSDTPIWRPACYGLGGLLLAAAGFAFISDRRARLATLPITGVCAFSAALILTYPIGVVAKSHLVAMILCATVAVLTASAGPTRSLQFVALAVTFNAVMCLVDIVLPHGFTNTAGRAAGFAEGPNVAAAQLVLGAVVVWRAVPARVLWSFLILVVAALVATLSRSGMIIALMASIVATIGCVMRKPQIVPIRWRDVALGIGALVWLAVAMGTNHHFSVAGDSAVETVSQAADAIINVPSNIAIATPPAEARQELKEINQRVETESDINSASARSLLMRRALIRYSMSPWTGVGPAEAHALAPHNTYLLLGLAFGVAGLLVPIAFIGLAGMAAIRTGNWEFPLALAAFFALSHDVLLFPSIIVILSAGLAATAET